MADASEVLGMTIWPSRKTEGAEVVLAYQANLTDDPAAVEWMIGMGDTPTAALDVAWKKFKEKHGDGLFMRMVHLRWLDTIALDMHALTVWRTSDESRHGTAAEFQANISRRNDRSAWTVAHGSTLLEAFMRAAEHFNNVSKTKTKWALNGDPNTAIPRMGCADVTRAAMTELLRRLAEG